MKITRDKKSKMIVIDGEKYMPVERAKALFRRTREINNLNQILAEQVAKYHKLLKLYTT